MSGHYFSADPTVPEQRHTMQVMLNGEQVTVTSANGVFSADRLDKATRILLDEVPAPPQAGHGLDIGCGWGPIALSLARQAPDLSVWAIDVNERAMDLARTNAQALGCDNITVGTAADVPADIEFAVIWSNPPIRIGKAELDELLAAWLPRLAVGGNAWMVVGKNLGADSLQRRLGATLGAGFEVSRHSTSGGFRILRVERLA